MYSDKTISWKIRPSCVLPGDQATIFVIFFFGITGNLLINGIYTFSVDESPSIITTGGGGGVQFVCAIYCTEHIWKVANGVEA